MNYFDHYWPWHATEKVFHQKKKKSEFFVLLTSIRLLCQRLQKELDQEVSPVTVII
jgi:hypothetical protein